MGVGLFDTLTYQAWQIVLMTFGLMAVGFAYGYYMAYEKINERSNRH
ncbi:hypothetical protein [Collinsella sp. HCP28S3_H5]